MRYSGWALLVFGAGGLLGLGLVSTNLAGIGWTASATMAAGLALLPVALVADWWAHRPWRKPPTGRNRKRISYPKARSKSSPPRKRGARGK
jgi:hypothetical protein